MPTYQIDSAHTHAQFKVRHMMISNVKGEFTKVTGTVDYDPAHPTAAKVDVSIDVNSINTREPQRDGHLKSPDFFDAANHPTITFKSTDVVASGKDSFEIVGDLTIRGITKKVALEVEDVTPEIKDPFGFYRFGATAKTSISRTDFGLLWNAALEAGGVMIGEKVEITIDAELARQA